MISQLPGYFLLFIFLISVEHPLFVAIFMFFGGYLSVFPYKNIILSGSFHLFYIFAFSKHAVKNMCCSLSA